MRSLSLVLVVVVAVAINRCNGSFKIRIGGKNNICSCIEVPERPSIPTWSEQVNMPTHPVEEEIPRVPEVIKYISAEQTFKTQPDQTIKYTPASEPVVHSDISESSSEYETIPVEIAAPQEKVWDFPLYSKESSLGPVLSSESSESSESSDSSESSESSESSVVYEPAVVYESSSPVLTLSLPPPPEAPLVSLPQGEGKMVLDCNKPSLFTGNYKRPTNGNFGIVNPKLTVRNPDNHQFDSLKYIPSKIRGSIPSKNIRSEHVIYHD